jgi:hypothetical protein
MEVIWPLAQLAIMAMTVFPEAFVSIYVLPVRVSYCIRLPLRVASIAIFQLEKETRLVSGDKQMILQYKSIHIKHTNSSGPRYKNDVATALTTHTVGSFHIPVA